MTNDKAVETRLYLVNTARDTIERYIFDRVLRPDQRLIESELANKLGLSRTPVREALRQLEIKGLITKLPTGGYVVTYYTATDVQNIFEIREALETLAMKLACDRATQSQLDRAEECCNQFDKILGEPHKEGGVDWNNLFHEELYKACGNKQLIATIQNLRDVVQLKHVSQSYSNEDFYVFGREHRSILEAVRQRDKKKAEQAVRKHLKTVCSSYIRSL
jgi:DNA-binding GntR family transcriptional regulator